MHSSAGVEFCKGQMRTSKHTHTDLICRDAHRAWLEAGALHRCCCLGRFSNGLYTPAIIIMHLALSFRPLAPLWTHAWGQDRWRTWRKQVTTCRTYLQLPEDLRLAAGLQVPQSLGPEAVLLVQGAVAPRRAEESTTTQEPEHESSMAASRGRGCLQKAGKAGNAALFLFLFVCVLCGWKSSGKSPTMKEILRLKSPRVCIFFKGFFFIYLFIFLFVLQKSPKKPKKHGG